ncbi:MAG TPA: prepilin-type N-terminal cleavage/methylation domain-containing protein [Phycisphaerales bacterium]|nr:prepilin-type N-terminal cleavage/methylation domain-containing protein [Phycisphaerales bacterium]
MQRVNPSSARSSAPRGFTLIELLVVIFIIIVLVAITVPALASVRKSARVTETRGFMQGLATAIQTFELDKKSLPGYFSARDMGRQTNETNAGFSGMQNVMLDLAGGWVADTGNGSPGTNFRLMGPDLGNQATRVYVDPALVGSANNNSKQYFTPTAKNWRKQDGVEGGSRANGGTTEHDELPELVDAFGAPILAWVDDTTGPRKFDNTTSFFARADSGAGVDAARFYRASNAAFLTPGVASLVGTKRVDQVRSLLNTTRNDNDIAANLTGFLGNPASPKNAVDAAVTVANLMPTAARGGVVLHSAGVDGVYLSEEDKGAAVRGTAFTQLHYGLNFRDIGNNPLRDAQNRNTNIDIVAGFDDIVQATGN